MTITDQLFPDFDWTSFRLTEFGFGDTLQNVPANTQYHQATIRTTVDGKVIDVLVEAGIDTATGRIYASFQSLDPVTQLPPDVLTGFLPPEDGTGRGMGHLGYTVRPRAGLPTGTEIRNVALITFDGQTSIRTDQVAPHDPSLGVDLNKQARVTIDAGSPRSRVAALAPVQDLPTFLLAWSGEDDAGGSGIASYTIYVSDNSGPFVPYVVNTTETSTTFRGRSGHTYRFYSVARDNVGNLEPIPAQAQATTRLDILLNFTVTASLASPTYGQSLRFDAALAPINPSLSSPTGTVQFLVDGNLFGSPVALVGGRASSDFLATLGGGVHSIVAIYSGDDTFAEAESTIEQVINKATLVVTAQDASKVYGAALPGFSYTLGGFVNGDTASASGIAGQPALTTDATAASPVGTYAIRADAGSLTSPNYRFLTGPPATLAVTPAPLTVIANDQHTDRGDGVPTLTYRFSGLVNGDTPSSIAGTAILSTAVTPSSPAGFYAIAIARGTLDNPNYTLTLQPGLVTVHPKVLDVRARYGSRSISLLGLTRNLPFLNIDAIDVLFSDDIEADLADLGLTGLRGAAYNSSAFRYNPEAQQGRWTLPTALGIDRLMLTLDGSVATGIRTPGTHIGLRNPFELAFSVLPGDVNGDGVVNSQDQVIVRNQMTGAGDPNFPLFADVNGDGVIDLNDFNAVKKKNGTSLK